MKYTKSILSFLLLNLVLVFAMIIVANKTREIEKNNKNLQTKIFNISQNLKINKIELITHQNVSYLIKLHSIYFPEFKKNQFPNLVSINQIFNKNENTKLIKTKN